MALLAAISSTAAPQRKSEKFSRSHFHSAKEEIAIKMSEPEKALQTVQTTDGAGEDEPDEWFGLSSVKIFFRDLQANVGVPLGTNGSSARAAQVRIPGFPINETEIS